MIKFGTARNICFCYQQLEEGEKLLKKCVDHIEEHGSLAYREGERVAHLTLGIPDSLSGNRILQVDDELAMKMIRKHIYDKKEELKNLNMIAEKEAAEND